MSIVVNRCFITYLLTRIVLTRLLIVIVSQIMLLQTRRSRKITWRLIVRGISLVLLSIELIVVICIICLLLLRVLWGGVVASILMVRGVDVWHLLLLAHSFPLCD